MPCLACGKQAQDRYCAYHEKALNQLRDHYDKWVHAYGNISWENFLERLEGKNDTGAWVKEVIKAELKK
jgi:DNA-directed RNA polymerase subunit N (RpoN/RPB10)